MGPALLALGYFLGSLVGLSVQFPATQVSVFWPPNAILLAALLLTPRSRWWLYLAAVLPAHAVAQLWMGIAPTVMLVNFAGNAGDALLGAWIVDRLLPRPRRFDELKAVTAIVFCGGLLAPAITSLLVAEVFDWMGATTSLWVSWRLRLLTNALAVVTLVPPLVLAFSPVKGSLSAAQRSRRAEAALLAVGLLVVGLMVFTPPGGEDSGILLYAPFPFLLWAAMRFGIVGASLSVLTLGGLSLSAALRGVGPFIAHDPTENATSLVVFLLVSGIPLLLLAAVMNERASVDEGRRRIQTLHGAVLGSLREEIAVVDRDGTVLEVNESWRAAGRAVPGDDCVDHLRREVRAAAGYGAGQLLSGIDAVLSGARERFQVELPVTSSPATWYELSARALQRPEGGAVITRSDITARKLAELDSREQRRELAHLTRVATLGELSGAMAHELSQPLTAILSNAQAAQRLLARPSPDLREINDILGDIADDDRRAGEVIQRLRAMLRKDEPQFVPLDLNDLIRDVLLLERSDLIARSVVVVTELADDLPLVRGDRVQLQQVVLNLVLNACEAMSATRVGQRRIVLITARDQEGAQLDVVDHGTGIPADALERVFEPFFTTKKQGLGLGLSICRSIVETHGGRLWASNNEESGATFHLALAVDAS